ncbi:hypothetical protein [Glutamicibacter sp.]|uniref:hypothetical protein n=1 Tax=Glutamicibacter sp. TaxID=1931995 RepID=UPI002B471A18|nr:hypothetical protein [Glutamicibacter sp.]HJX76796.1 hypothetical protein [Glutamicibacter sp.]
MKPVLQFSSWRCAGRIAQIPAGVIESIKGNVLGATAFTSNEGFWWLETTPAVAEAAGSAGFEAF